MGIRRILAALSAAAFLLTGGCAGSITGYAGRSAEAGGVCYRIDARGKTAFAEACIWDLDPTHLRFDIADSVEGAVVERLGGFIGTGVPIPFRIEPEEGSGCLISADPSLESFDVPVTWQDLEFTVYLGKNLSRIARIQDPPYYGIRNPSGGVDFCRPVVRFVCDEGNKTFYSRDGVLYTRSGDAPVEELSGLQEARPSGSSRPTAG